MILFTLSLILFLSLCRSKTLFRVIKMFNKGLTHSTRAIKSLFFFFHGGNFLVYTHLGIITNISWSFGQNPFTSLHLFHVSFWFLKVPSFKWFLWKSTPKFPYLKACVIILRDLSSFQKRILNLPGYLKSWKFDRICILCYPFGF